MYIILRPVYRQFTTEFTLVPKYLTVAGAAEGECLGKIPSVSCEWPRAERSGGGFFLKTALKQMAGLSFSVLESFTDHFCWIWKATFSVVNVFESKSLWIELNDLILERILKLKPWKIFVKVTMQLLSDVLAFELAAPCCRCGYRTVSSFSCEFLTVSDKNGAVKKKNESFLLI